MAYSVITTPATGTTISNTTFGIPVKDNFDAAFPLGVDAWPPYTPVFTGVTLGTGSTVEGAYQRVGRTIFWRAYLTLGTGGALTGSVTMTLPVTGSAGMATNLGAPGMAVYDDFTANMIIGAYEYTTTTIRYLALGTATTYLDRQFLSGTVPFTWAVSDKIRASGFYEAAA